MLLLAGWTFKFVFSIAILVILSPTYLVRDDSPSWITTGLGIYTVIVAPLVQGALAITWSAVGAYFTTIMVGIGEMSTGWMVAYYVIGFFGTVWPLWSMAGEEQIADVRDGEESTAKGCAQMVLILVVAASFIIFSIFPNVPKAIYGNWLQTLVHRDEPTSEPN